jgi:hypothetical protein
VCSAVNAIETNLKKKHDNRVMNESVKKEKEKCDGDEWKVVLRDLPRDINHPYHRIK